MDLAEKVTMKCAEQVDENNKLRLINHEKQEENMKLLFDLSTTRAACEQQAHLRLELEQQLNDAKTIIEQVWFSFLPSFVERRLFLFRIIPNAYKS